MNHSAEYTFPPVHSGKQNIKMLNNIHNIFEFFKDILDWVVFTQSNPHILSRELLKKHTIHINLPSRNINSNFQNGIILDCIPGKYAVKSLPSCSIHLNFLYKLHLLIK